MRDGILKSCPAAEQTAKYTIPSGARVFADQVSAIGLRDIPMNIQRRHIYVYTHVLGDTINRFLAARQREADGLREPVRS